MYANSTVHCLKFNEKFGKKEANLTHKALLSSILGLACEIQYIKADGPSKILLRLIFNCLKLLKFKNFSNERYQW